MGTRGDVQPFVALAVGLAERGWRPVVAGPLEYREWVISYGIEFTGLGLSLQVGDCPHRPVPCLLAVWGVGARWYSPPHLA